MKNWFRLLARKTFSRSTRRRLARLAVWPPVGMVRFGYFRRLEPLNRNFGNRRGLEIDRYYIEKFITEFAADIRGHVLEIKHNVYTTCFGQDRVTKSDVLHPVEGNPDATIVADLTQADHLPSDVYDAIIFTQTLQFIYDIKTTVATLYRILKPGGVLLATVPAIAQIDRVNSDLWGEYWRFTSMSAQRIFEEAFPAELVSVRAYGNVMAAISFLEGLACEDLQREELEAIDSDYEILIAIRAVKPPIRR